MSNQTASPKLEERPALMIGLGSFAILGCLVFAACVVIADFVVPDHDWIADTISDLGAGRYEFIVDVGIYAFSASLLVIALLAAHVHLGGWGWSFGILSFALISLIVFLIGARNEYGDNDSEGVVIHTYLVYLMGLLFAVGPALMSKGAARAGKIYRQTLIGLAIAWAVCSPVFFFLPNDIDGIYERLLFLIASAIIITLALLFIQRGRGLSR